MGFTDVGMGVVKGRMSYEEGGKHFRQLFKGFG